VGHQTKDILDSEGRQRGVIWFYREVLQCCDAPLTRKRSIAR